MSSEPTDAALEFLGFGKQQIIVLIPGGATYAATSAVALAVAQAARAVAIEAGMKHYAGLLCSIYFSGCMIGNLLGGPFADRYGRRIPILVGMAGLAVCQALAVSWASNASMLVGSFLGCGLFVGLGLTAAVANMREWTPARLRSSLFCMLFVCFTCGHIATGVFFSLTSPHLSPEGLQWKLLFKLQAVFFCMTFVFSALMLPESALWLSDQMMLEEAQKELMSAAYRNGVVLDEEAIPAALSHVGVKRDVEESTPLTNAGAKSHGIFSGSLFRTTMIMCSLDFMINSCYYGLMVTLPSTLFFAFKGSEVAAANVMLISILFELPGIALQDFLGCRLSRQVNLVVTCLAASISLGLLGASLVWQYSAAVALSSILSRFSIMACYTSIYVTMSEAYPTSCRATGCAFCMTFGRLGAILAPLIYFSFGPGIFYSSLSMLAFSSGIAGSMLKL